MRFYGTSLSQDKNLVFSLYVLDISSYSETLFLWHLQWQFIISEICGEMLKKQGKFFSYFLHSFLLPP